MESDLILKIVVYGLSLLAGAGVISGTLYIAVNKVAKKLEKWLEGGAKIGDAVAAQFRSWGMPGVADKIEEGADVADEAGDLARVTAEITKDKEITEAEARRWLEEGKDVDVEFKDFVVKVINKKKRR